MRHRIKHHVNRPVLHFGLFSDRQIMPAAVLVTLAAGWAFAGDGSIVARGIVAALMMLPVGVMVVDNRVGGLVLTQVRAFLRWRREPGIFMPAVDDVIGCELVIDPEDQMILDREQRASVDLEAVFTSEA